MMESNDYIEESSSVLLDLVLFGQIIQTSHRDLQPGGSQEGRQVSRVGGDDDEAEEPPCRGHHSA